ncbi:tumor necrosis factor receptor superfamily member 5 [Microcaecilia unicolor]|uniref:Tumor necrosis factor receptor superfamily member 5 n=1 Tax=Microcaecilia unicolor TaxID=1415580 RepID=A0A6P7YNY9_9AMPH|nr:tumor necrosis factor receptor superfamily member 5 [Microcaecilia unicolor]
MELRYLFCLLFSGSLQFYPVFSLTCDTMEYENAGRCCKKCSPGYKIDSDCTDTTETQCKACSNGEYQATWNQEKACHLHRYCDNNAGLIVKTQGTDVIDTMCECVTGRHCSSEECATCVKDTPCGLGFGVVQRATQSSDTKCEACPPGAFSNISSSVEPCSNFTRCENLGMVMKKHGTNVSDVICETRLHPGIIAAVIVVSALAVTAVLLIILRYRSCVKKKIQFRDPPAEKKVMIPVEAGLDEFELPHQAPVQETLSGQQPVVQEEGKDSRMPQQEIE